MASVPVHKKLISVRGVLSEHPNKIAVSSARRVSTDSTAERRRRVEERVIRCGGETSGSGEQWPVA